MKFHYISLYQLFSSNMPTLSYISCLSVGAGGFVEVGPPWLLDKNNFIHWFYLVYNLIITGFRLLCLNFCFSFVPDCRSKPLAGAWRRCEARSLGNPVPSWFPVSNGQRAWLVVADRQLLRALCAMQRGPISWLSPWLPGPPPWLYRGKINISLCLQIQVSWTRIDRVSKQKPCKCL